MGKELNGMEREQREAKGREGKGREGKGREGKKIKIEITTSYSPMKLKKYVADTQWNCSRDA